VVRNHHEGKAVDYIDYQCYEPMALKELKQIAHEIRSEFRIAALTLIHRIGVVRVGEASLLVVAQDAHRAPVLDAVKECVDRLKRRVPIWKKEYGPDGSHWVQGIIPDAHFAPGTPPRIPRPPMEDL
jgi:molybdopterin synthase catalytic subunit